MKLIILVLISVFLSASAQAQGHSLSDQQHYARMQYGRTLSNLRSERAFGERLPELVGYEMCILETTYSWANSDGATFIKLDAAINTICMSSLIHLYLALENDTQELSEARVSGLLRIANFKGSLEPKTFHELLNSYSFNLNLEELEAESSGDTKNLRQFLIEQQQKIVNAVN